VEHLRLQLSQRLQRVRVRRCPRVHQGQLQRAGQTGSKLTNYFFGVKFLPF